jgi:hypothetical protein
MRAFRWNVPVRRIEWLARTVHVYATTTGNDMPLRLYANISSLGRECPPCVPFGATFGSLAAQLQASHHVAD